MDLKELDKRQLILLTLLITFVVSIATGIVTVSLMQQMPKSVPQTINNVIQRTIEKVTTVQTPPVTNDKTNPSEVKEAFPFIGDGDVIVPIYSIDEVKVISADTTTTTDTKITPEAPKPLGQGIIISDVGLILVESSILTDKDLYKVTLGKSNFDAKILKKFGNGFTILKITLKPTLPEVKTASPSETKLNIDIKP